MISPDGKISYRWISVLPINHAKEVLNVLKKKYKILHELSFGTWLIHISSVIEWIFAISVINKISTYKKYNLFFWLSLAMIPNLIGAMCAITWHIYDNQENLYGLVSLQGIFTFIGNTTLALAAIKMFRGKDSYE